MYRILYAGDLHAADTAEQSPTRFKLHFQRLKKLDQIAIKYNCSAIVQVGDLGIYSRSSAVMEYFVQDKELDDGDDRYQKALAWYFCDGNHDNHQLINELYEGETRDSAQSLLKTRLFHVPRGGYVKISGVSHVFCGGANTPENCKVLGEWWPTESITTNEINRFYDTLMARRPSVVVTHDAPSRVPAIALGVRSGDRSNNSCVRDLENVYRAALNAKRHYIPRRWVFGHHHVIGEWRVGSTTFNCVGVDGQYTILSG